MRHGHAEHIVILLFRFKRIDSSLFTHPFRKKECIVPNVCADIAYRHARFDNSSQGFGFLLFKQAEFPAQHGHHAIQLGGIKGESIDFE